MSCAHISFMHTVINRLRLWLNNRDIRITSEIARYCVCSMAMWSTAVLHGGDGYHPKRVERKATSPTKCVYLRAYWK